MFCYFVILIFSEKKNNQNWIQKGKLDLAAQELGKILKHHACCLEASMI